MSLEPVVLAEQHETNTPKQTPCRRSVLPSRLLIGTLRLSSALFPVEHIQNVLMWSELCPGSMAAFRYVSQITCTDHSVQCAEISQPQRPGACVHSTVACYLSCACNVSFNSRRYGLCLKYNVLTTAILFFSHSHDVNKEKKKSEKRNILNDSTLAFLLVLLFCLCFLPFNFWSERGRQTERDSRKWAGFFLETTRLFVALVSWEYVGLLFCSVLLFPFSDLIVTDKFRGEDWG